MDGANKLDKLKERLLYAAGKCSDYSRYSAVLFNLEEEYDETLEIYNLDIWDNNSSGTIRDKAQHMLRVTASLFSDLEDNASLELFHVMEDIMELDEDEQIKICDVAVDKALLTEDAFMNMLTEWIEHPYSQEEALQSFLGLLQEHVIDKSPDD